MSFWVVFGSEVVWYGGWWVGFAVMRSGEWWWCC